MKKVLFVIPKQSEDYPEYPHTGVGYLSEYLTSKNIDNKIIDMRLGHKIGEVINTALTYHPDFIAITMVTAGRDYGYDTVNPLKKAGFTIILGGPHVSMMKAKVLEECKADFAIKAEGEEALFELVSGKKSNLIKNLIYRKDSKVFENIDRPFNQHLDSLRWPKHEKAELEKYRGGGVSIVTSRGCPYQCVYCSAHFGVGRLYRARSPKNIIQELKYWQNKGFRYFHIVDDNFTFDKNRVIELCNLIAKNNIGATFACDGVRADRVDYSVLKKMREAGFKYLSFGVEGGNNRILNAIKKGETIEQIESSIKDAVSLGFDVYLFFIIGSPGETAEDVEDSLKFALKYPIAGANFYNLVPFPGTELYDYVLKHGKFLIEPEQYLRNVPYYSNSPVFETKEFPKEERRRMLIKSKKIRKEIRDAVLKKRLCKLGVIGVVAYPFLKVDFIKENILNGMLIKIPFIRNTIRKKTEQAFV